MSHGMEVQTSNLNYTYVLRKMWSKYVTFLAIYGTWCYAMQT